MVKINRWQPLNHGGDGIASFNFVVHGITVRAAMLTRRDGKFDVTMPFTRHRLPSGVELTAVGLTYDLRQQVLAAAIAYHKGGRHAPKPANDDYAAVRRVVRADVGEALERAGI